jgi:hypothetical protein
MSQPTLQASSASPLLSPARRQAILEVALIFLLYFLFAGGEPPGVNESHYLCKAKHYWNPAWCRHDLFLNSADAHAAFYWSLGWITQFASLTASAWIGRICVWLLQAWAWRRLSWSLVPRPWRALLTAAVYLALLKRGHMAGEWVVGDVEAKGIAYVFVFLGLEALIRQRWQWVFPLLGAGAAFHVLVGGWAVVAAGIAWLVLRLGRYSGEALPSPRSLLPSLAAGFVLSLPGLLPGLLLDRGTPPDVVAAGTVAYVYPRLSHHLVVHRFPPEYLVRHGALMLLAGALAWGTWRQPSLRRLYAFTLGAVLVAGVGVAIDQALIYQEPSLSARLLRYYWYRLSDATVPLAVAMCLGWLTIDSESQRAAPTHPPPAWKPWLLIALMTVGTANIVELYARRRVQGVPESALALDLRHGDAVLSVAQRHRDWTACCEWIAAHTDPDATFLTPRGQQTFKWYAGRSEVVSWKDAPQDAASLVAWLRRYEDVHPHPSGEPIMFGPEIDPALPESERYKKLGEKYHARYVLIDRAVTSSPAGLLRVYPQGGHFNPSFAVYQLPMPTDD